MKNSKNSVHQSDAKPPKKKKLKLRSKVINNNEKVFKKLCSELSGEQKLDLIEDVSKTEKAHVAKLFDPDDKIDDDNSSKYQRKKLSNPELRQKSFNQRKFNAHKEKVSYAIDQAAKSEILLAEASGTIELTQDEIEGGIFAKQADILQTSDIQTKHGKFSLKMNESGPHLPRYSRNGKFLLIGGRKGQLSLMEWERKKLVMELNVEERINDLLFFNQERMLAVAQNKWTYVYDNKGVELHCLKTLDEALCLGFLPYHWLLVSGHAKAYLNYLDVSTGKNIAGISTHEGRLDTMCVNQSNGIVHLGHKKGTVTMWSPTCGKEPLVKVMCHNTAILDVAIDRGGNVMATSGYDRCVKLWDLRKMYEPIRKMQLFASAKKMKFSESGNNLAFACVNQLQVFDAKIACKYGGEKVPLLLCDSFTSDIEDFEFCPLKDVAGVGDCNNFSSILVPGSGIANFDAFENANPFENVKQKKESEVKHLLDKIQPDLIDIDSQCVNQVDNETLLDKIDRRNEFFGRSVEASSKLLTNIEVKNKKSKHSTVDSRKHRLKQIQKDENVRNKIAMEQLYQEEFTSSSTSKKNENDKTSIPNPLSRFE